MPGRSHRILQTYTTSTELVIEGPAALTTEEKALALEHTEVQLELCIS